MLESAESNTTTEYLPDRSDPSPLDLKPEILEVMRSLIAFAGTRTGQEAHDRSIESDGPEGAPNADGEPPRLTGWYRPLLSVYQSLEHYAATNDPRLTRAVMQDPEVQNMLPELYALRARYETDFEFELARKTIASERARALISTQVDEKFHALPDAYYDVMRSSDRILFAGSGPLPTTALALSRAFGRPITCIDYNAQANEVAREYVKLSGCTNRITFLDGDLLDFDAHDRYDCIAGAFLLGMPTLPSPLSTKADFVKRLLNIIDGETSLVLRTSRSLGGLVYPLIDFDANRQCRQVEYPLVPTRSQPYDSTFVTWN